MLAEREKGRKRNEEKRKNVKINTAAIGNEFSMKGAITQWLPGGNLICCNKHQGKRPR